MGKFNEQEIPQTEHPQVYGIQQPNLREVDGTYLLSGLLYGHPLFKDGERVTVSSSKFKHWTVGEDEYFEADNGITYRTF